MHRMNWTYRTAALFLVLLIAIPGLAQSAKDETDIRMVVDQLIKGGNSVDRDVITAALGYFSTATGTMFPPDGNEQVSDLRRNPTKGLENVASRTFEMTTPLRITALKTLGWASFEWQMDSTMTDGSKQQAKGRATLVFTKEKKAWKVLHVHFSVPVQNAPSGAEKEAQAVDIIDIERNIWEGFRKGDLTPVEQYFADEVSVLEGNSAYRMSGKVDVLRGFRDMLKTVKVENYQILDPKVEVHGTAAVLTYYYTESFRMQGRPVTASGKITTIYAQQGGEWRVVHHHSSVNAPESGDGNNR